MGLFLTFVISPKIAENVSVQIEDGRVHQLAWEEDVRVVLNTTQAALVIHDLSKLLAEALDDE
jgi:hypothetical protein